MNTTKMPSIGYETFFETIAGPGAFILWDGNTAGFIHANKAFTAEVCEESVLPAGTDMFTKLEESDKKAFRDALDRVAKTGVEQMFEGKYHAFSCLCGYEQNYIRAWLKRVEQTPDGTIIFVSISNITRERAREDTVSDSELRFHYAAEQANVYAWEYDIATRQMRPCYRCMRDLKLPAVVENYPEPVFEAGIFPQEFAAMYRDWHRQLAAGVERLEAIIPLTPAKIPFHVRYSTVFDGAGKPVKAYGSATQVVGSEKERQYREIIGCLGKAYFGLYFCELATGSFYQLEKPGMRETEEVIGEKGNAAEAFLRMSQHLVAPEQAEEMLAFTDYTTLAERLKNRDTIGIHFRGQHIGWCEGLFIVAKRDEQGNCTHVIWGVRSIQQEVEKEESYKRDLEAALKTTEEALEEAKRANAARAAFLSRMSHDIRTPLNGILGLIEIDDRHPNDPETLRINRGKAKTAAKHLLALVSDVLELSKIDDKNVKLVEEPFNIEKTAEEVGTIAGLRAAEKGITLTFPDLKSFAEQPYVYGSPLYVKQLLLNIIGNAIKYNRPRGSVTCKAFMQREDEDTVRYTVTVADTGIGMSPEFLKHIYEPFSQEHSDARSVFQGTGLGMAIVKSLVDKMHGTIEVQSEPDKGSVFTVSVPFRIAKAEDMPKKRETANADVSGMRVLVVEDNTLNMEIIVSVLEDFGLLVTQAVNGKEAVDIYAENPPGSFDLILMDLMMPVLDGFGATEKIRAMEPPYGDIPIVAMTANAFTDDVQACYEKGMNGHLAKPLDIDKLLTVLMEFKR